MKKISLLVFVLVFAFAFVFAFALLSQSMQQPFLMGNVLNSMT